MILIITHKDDYTADYVIDKLNCKGLPYYRFNCEDYLTTGLSIDFDKIDRVSLGSNSNFSSAWYRRLKLPYIDTEHKGEKIFLLHEIDALYKNLFTQIQCKWLSSPAAVEQAENKLLQLSLAQQVGFNIPKTLITTSREELFSFAKKNHKTIIKPLHSGRVTYNTAESKLIFTNILSEEIVDNLGDYELTPAIYQSYIEKAYELRVTVVGDDIFAAKIDSTLYPDSLTDWRKGKVQFEQYRLPTNIKQKCLALLAKLGISFGAFDLVCDPHGEYHFIEVNPNGQWVWIEKDTGLPIADAIIKFLS